MAVGQGEALALLRALSDGMSNGHVSMVVVAQAHCGRRIGSALVRAAMGDEARLAGALRAGRGGVSVFYEKRGFTAPEVAMERCGARMPRTAPPSN